MLAKISSAVQEAFGRFTGGSSQEADAPLPEPVRDFC